MPHNSPYLQFSIAHIPQWGNCKNSFKNSWIRIVIRIPTKSNQLMLVTHPSRPKISKFVHNFFSVTLLTDRQTDSQTHNSTTAIKHNIFDGCKTGRAYALQSLVYASELDKDECADDAFCRHRHTLGSSITAAQRSAAVINAQKSETMLCFLVQMQRRRN